MRAWLALLVAGCGGSPDSGDPPERTWPSDSSFEGIAAFLAGEAHRGPGWVAETDAPREANTAVSPHGRVRVWFNDVLVDSARQGGGQPGGAPHPTGAMTVKELYDGADQRLGHAVMLKVDGGAADWVYACDETPTRCGHTEVPTWGVGLDTDCGFCHGGQVFNSPP